MKDSTLPYWLTLLVVVASAYAFWAMRNDRDAGKSFGSRSVEESPDQPLPRPLPAEFELTDHRGQLLRSKDLHGKVWVASFFFTSCAGSCFRLNQALQSLQENEALRDVHYVSITCDPENDSVEALAEYSGRFAADPARWRFCRGELDYVQAIGKDMMTLAVERQTHSDRAVVFDRAGDIRGQFVVTDPNRLAMMGNLLRKCIDEKTEDRRPKTED